MPGALVKEQVVALVRAEMLKMQFDVPVIDSEGNVVGTTKSIPQGDGINQFSEAIGSALYEVLKTQVIVDVTTTGGPGTGLIR